MLVELFNQLNGEHFDAFLDAPELCWNSRLRSSAGRFHPGSRRYFKKIPAKIEIATYLKDEEKSLELIRDTMAHEMIHYWLWVRGRPYGHTGEFLAKMREMGCSRYNPVPKLRPYRYEYACLSCEKPFLARRKLGTLACAQCCNEHAGGRFDSRFKLVLRKELVP